MPPPTHSHALPRLGKEVVGAEGVTEALPEALVAIRQHMHYG
jgi:hypothetical protein